MDAGDCSKSAASFARDSKALIWNSPRGIENIERHLCICNNKKQRSRGRYGVQPATNNGGSDRNAV